MANTTTTNATCHLIYQSITSPTTYIYACLFIISGIIAAAGNTLALVILWQPQMRTKANKILRSLVVSDAMVGYVLFPYSTYMMFTPSTLKVCIWKIYWYLSIQYYYTLCSCHPNKHTMLFRRPSDVHKVRKTLHRCPDNIYCVNKGFVSKQRCFIIHLTSIKFEKP